MSLAVVLLAVFGGVVLIGLVVLGALVWVGDHDDQNPHWSSE